MSAPKPPLALGVEVTSLDGIRTQWDARARSAGNRPLGLRFSTRLGDGWSDGGATLNRPIDRDSPDVGLLGAAAFYGHDGETAYEGRIAANPRSLDGSPSMDVLFAGWIANTQDRKFEAIIIDRDLSKWSGPGLLRQSGLGINGYNIQAAESAQDSSNPSLITRLTSPWSDKKVSEAWYDAGSARIGSIIWSVALGFNVSTGDGNWHWNIATTNDDEPSALVADTGSLVGGATSGTLTTDPARFGVVTQRYEATLSTALDYDLAWQFAVVGDHGLTLRAPSDSASGFYASDVIRWIITSFCPALNTRGVEDTTRVIPQLVFARQFPFDAITEVNKYHRWQFGVEEGRTFYFRGIDYSNYDWQVGEHDFGVKVKLQGDSTDGGVHNGITVTFTDIDTGRVTTLTPDDTDELADTDPTNPANLAGYPRWDEITLSTPTDGDSAIAIAQAALAERNSPQGQGTITVEGHIRDRYGNWQQGWKVRAGHTVSITSSVALSDRPRLISETSWDQDSKTLTITVEDTADAVDAWLDRQSTDIAAARLG